MGIVVKSKSLFVLLATVSTALASIADGDLTPEEHKRFYVRAGLALPAHRYVQNRGKTTFRVGQNIAIGMSVYKSFSTEIEFIRLPMPSKIVGKPPIAGDYREMLTTSLLGNVIYKPTIVASDRFKPFIGAGLGYAIKKTGPIINKYGTILGDVPSSKAYGMAYQAIIGMLFKVNKNFSIIADARWVDLGKAKFADTGHDIRKKKVQAMLFSIGLRQEI